MSISFARKLEENHSYNAKEGWVTNRISSAILDLEKTLISFWINKFQSCGFMDFLFMKATATRWKIELCEENRNPTPFSFQSDLKISNSG